MPEFDAIDQRIVDQRAAELNRIHTPRVGDWVVFADGVQRRISHLWDDGAQTSDDGRFYLDDGAVSFSGSLYPSVALHTLTATGEQRLGSVWIFHHDQWARGNGVDTHIPFRVYRCHQTAPR
jgi:hypothetical protein